MKNKNQPTMVQAGIYASIIHYMKALEANGSNPRDGVKMVEKMKSMPTDDALFGKGEIQPNGRKIHPGYLFEVKKPQESKYPGDYYKLIATIPATCSSVTSRPCSRKASVRSASGRQLFGAASSASTIPARTVPTKA
jgi:hypothetical protein